MTAKLYIVPTPIGNLEDITLRAIRVLKAADLILAEDTRTTSVLLKHHGIETPVKSHHLFNEHRKVPQFAERVLNGETIAIVSDAGTPGISDPGFLLIRECLKLGVDVECLPGATAFIPALVCSGLPCDCFYFEGFLPQKKGRQTRLKILSEMPHTVVLYESPHRLIKALEECIIHFGVERRASVSRELTKIHEETRRGTLPELADYFKQKPVKGELVIVIEGKRN